MVPEKKHARRHQRNVIRKISASTQLRDGRALTLHPQALAQVLDGLRLASSGRPLGRPSKREAQGTRQRHVAPVGHRGYHEPGLRAEILAAVRELRSDLLDVELVVVPVEVVPELHLPAELGHAIHFGSVELLDDVAVVHVDRDERHEDLALELGEIAADEVRELRELSDVGAQEGAQLGDRVGGLEACLDALAPEHVGGGEDELPGMLEDPLLAGRVGVRDDGLLGEALERRLHALLHEGEPRLNLPAGLEGVAEGDLLPLGRHHCVDVGALLLVAEDEAGDAVEALVQVRLHGLWLLALGQDLEEVVVGEKVEAGEGHLLLLEVRLEVLLDLLQHFVALGQALQPLRGRARLERTRALPRVAHDLLELVVDLGELPALGGQLLADVARLEDGLQVHPLLLDLEPLIERVAEHAQVCLHAVHVLADARDEAA